MKKHKNLFIVLAIILVASVSIIIATSEKNNNIYKEKESIKKSYSNGIAMMLETEAGSGNYEMTTRSEWPTEGYVFNANLSKCENGSELSWDNENKKVLMSGNKSDKCYVYFDVYVKPRFDQSCNDNTLACHTAKLYTGTQGENGIYYHDASLTNGAGDNSYRFAGASDKVNNYVCFGSTTTPCPADNLYRIIGVFGEQVKLIKSDYATSALLGADGDYKQAYTATGYDSSNYKGNNLANITAYNWNNTGKNTWSLSNLNKTNLNINFIANIGADWAAKIAETTWKVGGNTWANIGTQPAKTAYQNEVVKPVPGSTSSNGETEHPAKIGLMYASDYGFAAAQSAWTANLNTYKDEAIKNVNWMYMGLYEWTISRRTDDLSNAFYVTNTGLVGYNGYVSTSAYGVRPVFSLTSSVNYVSGSGTATEPITIN